MPVRKLSFALLLAILSATAFALPGLGTLLLGGSAVTGNGGTGGGGTGGGGGGGSGGGGSGSGLVISTATLNNCFVGLLCTQALTATGGTGSGYVFSKVSEFPNVDFWDNITPAGLRTGTPEYANTETVTYLVTDSGGNTNFKTFQFQSQVTGALQILTPTTLPQHATVGGLYTVRLLGYGGTPPYFWSSNLPNGAGVAGPPNPPCYLTFQGWLSCVPSSTGTTTITVTLKDNSGTSVSLPISFTTDTSLHLARVDSVDGVLHLPPVVANNPFRAVMHAYGGTPPYTYSATGLPAWASINTSTGTISGIPTSSGNVSPVITVHDSASATNTATGLINISQSNIVARPAYNSAVTNGPFVLNGQLYDTRGHIFHVRGTNQLHRDSGMQQYVNNTGANLVRIWDGGHSTATYLSLANTYISAGIMVDVGMGSTPTGTGLSGDNSIPDLDAATAWWVSNESAFAPIMTKMMLNLANEWGKSGADSNGHTLTEPQWAAANESEIVKLRAAGYTCPIVIDAYAQGESMEALTTYGAAILASDSEKNVILAWHPYQTEHYAEARITSVTTGATTKILLQSGASSSPLNSLNGVFIYNAQGMTQLNGAYATTSFNAAGSPGAWTLTLNVDSRAWTGTYLSLSATAVLDNDSQAAGRGDAHYSRAGDIIATTGLPIMIEEFGPSALDSPGAFDVIQPYTADFGQTVSGIESHQGIGWIEWAWDDNNLPGNKTAWNFYGYAINNPTYSGLATQLNSAGYDVILSPRNGLDALGSPAAFLQ